MHVRSKTTEINHMEIRDRVLDIVYRYQRNYTKYIRKDPGMYLWVYANSHPDSKDLKSKIFAAVYGLDLECPYGNIRFLRHEWKKGEHRLKTKGVEYALACKKVNGVLCKCTNEITSIESIRVHGEMSAQEKRDIDAKKRKTNRLRRGKDYPSQVEGLMPKKIRMPLDTYSKVNNIQWLTSHYVRQQKSASEIGRHLGINYTTVIDYLLKAGFKVRRRITRSDAERALEKYIKLLKVHTKSSDYSITAPYETDILADHEKLCIEYNGLRWHSSNIYCDQSISDRIQDSKHIKKTILAEDKSYELLHINEYEWLCRKEQTKSHVRRKLGKGITIDAASLQISEDFDYSKFTKENHIDRELSCEKQIALVDGEKVVMSVGYDIRKDIEIKQITYLLDHDVHGGLKEILTYLSKSNKDIIVSVDRMRTSGKEFLDAGMELLSITSPSYRWTDTRKLFDRSDINSSNIQSFCKVYNKELSIEKNLFKNRYRRYVDCGRKIFIMKVDNK